MKLPEKYAWLEKETAPKMIVEFVKIFGVREFDGPTDNPIIIQWAHEIGLDKIYVHDSIAWCGLEMAIIAKRSDKPIVKDPLWARNWLNFGTVIKSGEEMFGDVLVFERTGGGGHVGLYIAEDSDAFHVGGGNESDMSTIIRVGKYRLLGARRPVWKIAQPMQVRKIYADNTGKLSTNEA